MAPLSPRELAAHHAADAEDDERGAHHDVEAYALVEDKPAQKKGDYRYQVGNQGGADAACHLDQPELGDVAEAGAHDPEHEQRKRGFQAHAAVPGSAGEDDYQRCRYHGAEGHLQR